MAQARHPSSLSTAFNSTRRERDRFPVSAGSEVFSGYHPHMTPSITECRPESTVWRQYTWISCIKLFAVLPLYQEPLYRALGLQYCQYIYAEPRLCPTLVVRELVPLKSEHCVLFADCLIHCMSICFVCGRSLLSVPPTHSPLSKLFRR